MSRLTKAKTVPPDSYFSPELFNFLLELRFNNHRPWFEANRERYLQWAKVPMLRFIEDLAPRLRRLNPDFVASPRSLFRINRDTRFSANKAPYKTHIAAQFRHRLATSDVHMPGFYLHLEPEACFVAAGMWMPEPENLKRIRTAIARQEPRWLALRKKLELDLDPGAKLQRPPKGFEPSHPLIEDLKFKSFTATLMLSEEKVCSNELMEAVLKGFKKLNPLNVYLSDLMLLGLTPE